MDKSKNGATDDKFWLLSKSTMINADNEQLIH